MFCHRNWLLTIEKTERIHFKQRVPNKKCNAISLFGFAFPLVFLNGSSFDQLYSFEKRKVARAIAVKGGSGQGRRLATRDWFIGDSLQPMASHGTLKATKKSFISRRWLSQMRWLDNRATAVVHSAVCHSSSGRSVCREKYSSCSLGLFFLYLSSFLLLLFLLLHRICIRERTQLEEGGGAQKGPVRTEFYWVFNERRLLT